MTNAERAVVIIEASRATHVDWLAWQQRTPRWEAAVAARPAAVGDPAHHERYIADYDHVLALLRGELDPSAEWVPA